MTITERLITYGDPLNLRVEDEAIKGESDLRLNLQFLARRGVIDHITGNVSPRLKIVEFGCGKGAMALELAKRGAGLVVGLELDARDVQKAKTSAHRLGLENVVFVLADAHQPPFPENSFDLALSFDNLEHLSDLKGHLHEVLRVLAKKGEFLFETPNKLTDSLYQLTRKENGKRVHTKESYNRDHCSVQYLQPLEKMIKAVGFSKLDFEKMPFYNDVFKSKLSGTPLGRFLPIMDHIPVERMLPQWGYLMFHGAAQKG